MCETKRCSRCQREKPLDEFHNNRTAHDGKQWQCKDCTRYYARKRYVMMRIERKLGV
jgi:hypothetical protein